MPPDTDPLAAALAAEQAIADQAAEIRGDATTLTPELFLKLHPLLCEPIPAAFIVTTPRVKGKPYTSTGIKSVQVQTDRMNNVLTPLWWWDEARYYEQDGKLCEVTVFVGNYAGGTADSPATEVLVERRSWGGVSQGSTPGNIYKGSYTNAAKLALARLGVGHEVYLGATDLDPDVSGEAAAVEPAAPGEETAAETLTPAQAKALVDRAWKAGVKERLQLAVSYVAGRDVGECGTKGKAVEALKTLTLEQGERLDHWLAGKEEEAK